MTIQLDHQTLNIDIHQIGGWKARLYNQLTAILMPRELRKTLILVLGQTLPDFEMNFIFAGRGSHLDIWCMGYSPINLPILSKLFFVYPDRE